MGSLENKVRDCYREEPFPNILQKASDPKRKLDEFVRWTGSNLNFMNLPNVIKPGARVLVAGCGTGEEVLALWRLLKKPRILAIDMTDASLKIAKKNVQYFKAKGITFRKASILDDVPRWKEKFDLVYCSGVIHHLENPEKGFQILARLLAKNGHYAISLYLSYGLAVHNLRLRFLDLVAGQDFERRRAWAVRLKFPDYQVPQLLQDCYVHPQVKTYSIGQIKAWSDRAGLQFVGVAPPLGFRAMLAYVTENLAFTHRRKAFVKLVIAPLRIFARKPAPGLFRWRPVYAVFQQLLFVVMGKGECYYHFQAPKDLKKGSAS